MARREKFQKTNAMRELEAAGVPFSYETYEVDETDFSEPALLYFYAIYEGRVFGIEMWNPDFVKYLEEDPVLTCLCDCICSMDLEPEKE